MITQVDKIWPAINESFWSVTVNNKGLWYLQFSVQLKIFPAKVLETAASHQVLSPCIDNAMFTQLNTLYYIQAP